MARLGVWLQIVGCCLLFSVIADPLVGIGVFLMFLGAAFIVAERMK